MARDVTDKAPLRSRDDLVAWFEQGTKPRERFRVGTEHEKFGFYADTHAPVSYAGRAEGDGIEGLLNGLRERLGWEPIMEGPHIIGLHDAIGGGAISLEPGGQLELSGAPLASTHATRVEMEAHMAAVGAVAAPMGVAFMGLGMSPLWTLAETPVMPKGRYAIMRNYMPKVGTRGLDMMFRTCTVQANLDFSSEADMVKKLRVSLALQPITTALFANSPFTEGRPTGLLSGRSEVWRDTDNARAGMLAFAFEEGMGFERYVDYALDVPMYFIKRGDTYHDVAGQSFRDLMGRGLPGHPGEQATLSDWANHLSTIFPEVRLKRYLEMRGADMGSIEAVCALPALFTGLLYDDRALDGAWELVRHWSASSRQTLRDDVPRLGFKAVVDGRTVLDVARDMLALARDGLRRRGLRDSDGRDETIHLTFLDELVESGRTQAERWLALYGGAWGGHVDPVFDTCRL